MQHLASVKRFASFIRRDAEPSIDSIPHTQNSSCYSHADESMAQKPEVDASLVTTATGTQDRNVITDAENGPLGADKDDREYPHGLKLSLICVGLVMAVFCFALVCPCWLA